MSPKSESRVGFTQCNSACRIIRCCFWKGICPNQFPSQSLARITGYRVDSQVSFTVYLLVILASIFDTVSFIFLLTFLIFFHVSHPFKIVELTEAFWRRTWRLFGSLECAGLFEVGISGLWDCYSVVDSNQTAAVAWLHDAKVFEVHKFFPVPSLQG